MFVQALAEFADIYLADSLADPSVEEKPVPYLVEVSKDGSFLTVTERFSATPGASHARSTPTSMTVPCSPVNRTSGLHPLLAADDIKYVLGCGAWTETKDVDNHTERHVAFVELLRCAADETGDEGLRSCVRFYNRPTEVNLAREALSAARLGTLVALSQGGPVFGRPAVRNYWAEHFAVASARRMSSGGEGQCLISGLRGPIAPTHNKIKGLASLGGQPSGAALMSFDKEAFRSYGWEKNANSPASPDRAAAYVAALNELLRPGGGHRRDVGNTAFVFWTKEPSAFDPFTQIDAPDDAEVASLLRLDPFADPDPNRLYLVGLGANGARVLIRYWFSEHLHRVRANVRAWFKDLEIASLHSAGNAPAPSMNQLRRALHRDGEPPTALSVSLLSRALEGQEKPLGREILAAAVGRLRRGASARSEAFRYSLIRLCLNDLKGAPVQPQVDFNDSDPAYVCGRLLATFEQLQRAAHEGPVNQSVTDRYFSLASAYPAIAFPALERLARAHLQKLNRRPSVRTAIEKQVEELHLLLAGRFPAALPLEGQGRFAIGYYHERAHQFETARERRSAREASERED